MLNRYKWKGILTSSWVQSKFELVRKAEGLRA